MSASRGPPVSADVSLAGTMKPFALLFLLLCLLGTRSSAAQEPYFPPDRREELRREIDFGVAEEAPEMVPPSDNAPRLDLGLTGKILVGALVAGSLGALLFMILRDARRNSRNKPVLEVPPAAAIEEEVMVRRGVDPARIAEAESGGRYDLALRYHYLLALHRLDTAGLIRYRKDHGNREYRAQLADGGLREEFSQLARAYERHWYGQYPLAAAAYPALRDRFRALAGQAQPAAV